MILGHCCISARSHHVGPLIYTLSMPTVIISYIMAILFLINLCNALSNFHGISDVWVWQGGYLPGTGVGWLRSCARHTCTQSAGFWCVTREYLNVFRPTLYTVHDGYT